MISMTIIAIDDLIDAVVLRFVPERLAFVPDRNML